MKTIVDSISY